MDYSLHFMELSLVYQWYVSTGSVSFNRSTLFTWPGCQNRKPNPNTHLEFFRTTYLPICCVHLVTILFPFLRLLRVVQSLLLCSSDNKIFLTSYCDVTDHFTHTHTHTHTHTRTPTYMQCSRLVCRKFIIIYTLRYNFFKIKLSE
jgi:hypothetical protein